MPSVSGIATEWELDCIRWHGLVLDGEYGHWCDEWDDLPIDETCEEAIACHCYGKQIATRKVRLLHAMRNFLYIFKPLNF